jgi:aminopeptidase N
VREPQAKAVHLKDYTPPAFRVETIDLDVDIREDHALVKAKLEVRRNTPDRWSWTATSWSWSRSCWMGRRPATPSMRKR